MVEKNNIDFEGEETLFCNTDQDFEETGSEVEDNNIENTNKVYPDAILNISRETASVFQLKRKWEKIPSMLDLTPPFQRELVWTLKQKSELIESIIMGIPLPAFYVKENMNGVYIVVDGKQRLSTLFDFINGKFKLSSLSVLKNKKGQAFNDLTPLEQNKIEDYTLIINVIKAPTSDRVTFDLFDRVNRGGTRLNNQEMRNALYQGTSTRLIDELATSSSFLCATEHSIPSKHMKDRYLILRYLAFYLWYKHITLDIENDKVLEYKSNLEDFLGKTMTFLNTFEYNSHFILDLKEKFNSVMTIATSTILPLGGFRLEAQRSNNRRPINMAFFESFCCLIASLEIDDEQTIENSVKHAYQSLLCDEQYVKSLTYSIDSRNQITTRYKRIREYLSNS